MGVLENLITTLSPPCCIICNREGYVVCKDCLKTAIPVRKPACFWCNKLQDNGKTCTTCRPRTYLSGATIPFRFQDSVAELIYRLKYNGDRAIGRYFAVTLANHVPSGKFDYITYVASTGSSQRRRGYNQAQIIAKQLSVVTGIPLQNLLLRSSHVDQIGLNRQQRLASVGGSFVKTSYNVLNKRILLIDDVVTTGATINECSKVLKNNGAKSVWALAVAKK